MIQVSVRPLHRHSERATYLVYGAECSLGVVTSKLHGQGTIPKRLAEQRRVQRDEESIVKGELEYG